MQIAKLEYLVFDACARNSPSNKILLQGCKKYYDNTWKIDFTWFLKAENDLEEMEPFTRTKSDASIAQAKQRVK